ncbi:MAG TPA: polysaccharide deacetylase family protein [Pseudolabrys sp.]
MRFAAVVAFCLVGSTVPAMAALCPGNPNAIGTSRTITVEPSALPRIGTVQYRTTLPLNDHEVAITFDDGPLPPYTNRILDTLASECVKVTYFLVGRMASAYPDLVRRIYNSGHVIGTHSQNHPLTFDQMALPRIEREVGAGIASVQAAVGDARAVAPFFRIPGLLRTKQVETYLAAQSLAVWSADEVADDWYKGMTAKDIVRKAISRIEAKGHRGVLLLHDIHPATAMALPTLLKELKAKGYRIVQAVPAGDRPKSVPERPAPVVADSGGWPRVVKTSLSRPAKAIKAVHRKRVVHNARDPAITASIAKKKSKTKTAASGYGWTLFHR